MLEAEICAQAGGVHWGLEGTQGTRLPPVAGRTEGLLRPHCEPGLAGVTYTCAQPLLPPELVFISDVNIIAGKGPERPRAHLTLGLGRGLPGGLPPGAPGARSPRRAWASTSGFRQAGLPPASRWLTSVGSCLCLPCGPGRFLTRCSLSGSQEQSCRLALQLLCASLSPQTLQAPLIHNTEKVGLCQLLLLIGLSILNCWRTVGAPGMCSGGRHHRSPRAASGCPAVPVRPQTLPGGPLVSVHSHLPHTPHTPSPYPGLGSVDLHRLHLHFPEDLSLESVPERVPSGRAGPRGGQSLCAPELCIQMHLTCVPQPSALRLVTSPPHNHEDGRCVMEAQSGANTHCSRPSGPDAALCAPARRKPTSDARWVVPTAARWCNLHVGSQPLPGWDS